MPQPISPAMARLKSLLAESIRDSKAPGRFYPDFHLLNFTEGSFSLSPDPTNEDAFDPLNNMDAAMQSGLNSWLTRIARRSNPDLYQEIFSFAHVSKLEHHSPLVLQLSVTIGATMAVTTLPALLLYGLMRATAKGRQDEARTKILESQAQQQREIAHQLELKTKMMAEVERALNSYNQGSSKLGIPPEVLLETVRIAAPAVADLKDSPLVGSMTVGISTKT
jgi:hypothetical protein